jgi:peptidoglycan-N-acetylglucosamine deacetylase
MCRHHRTEQSSWPNRGALASAPDLRRLLLKCGSKGRELIAQYFHGGTLVSRYVLGLAGQRTVWLTFDDGPHPEHTPMILEALNKRSIRATFFVVGERAEKYLRVVQEAFNEGHRIGNHSFTHPNLTKLDRAGIRNEIKRTDEVITQFSKGGKLFRPPYGARNLLVDSVATELGYRTIQWTASTRDWDRRYQPDRWVRRGTMMVRLSGKSTVLLHDDRSSTAQHLGQFLDSVAGLLDDRFMAPEAL